MSETITLNGIEYAPVTKQGDIKIMILQRGFVYVGCVTRDGDNVRISSAQNVRQWGTTRGLGELAVNGPTDKTRLDPAGTVCCHVLGVVAEVSCDQGKWEALCK